MELKAQAPQPASVQMAELKEIDSALRGEYTVRRRMLIERAKVTLKSFMWAERLQREQGAKQPAEAAALQGEALMHNEPAVSLDDVFRARQGQAGSSHHVDRVCLYAVLSLFGFGINNKLGAHGAQQPHWQR